MSITLTRGQNLVTEIVRWTQAAEKARAQGDNLRADTYQSRVNEMLAILTAPQQTKGE